MWLTDQIAIILHYLEGDQLSLLISLNILSIIINLLFAIIIFYKALQNPGFFHRILNELENIKYKS